MVVYNYGHMVPCNRPGPAFDLLLRLLRHEKIIDKASPSVRISPIGADIPPVGADTAAWTTRAEIGSTRVDAGVAIISLILGAALALAVMKVSPTLLYARKRRDYEEVYEGNVSFHFSQ